MNMVLRRHVLSPARRKRQRIRSLVRKWFYEALGSHKHLRVSKTAPEYPNCKEIAVRASIEFRSAKTLDKPACLRRTRRDELLPKFRMDGVLRGLVERQSADTSNFRSTTTTLPPLR
jgi:hypothetical protein